MALHAKCTKSVFASRVKVEENKRKAIFRNLENAEFEISQIDGCLVTEGVRADYLVSEKGVASVIVELKGRDIEHACEQLLSSAAHSSVKPLIEAKVGFLVICSKYPRFDTFVARAKQACAKKYKAGFHVVCNQGEFDISRVTEIDGPY